MKNCKNCGMQNSDDAEFCTNCGVKIEDVSQIEVSEVEVVKNHNIKERNIAVAIVLSIITCGLYSIYWMIKINDEALELSGENGTSGGMVFLLTLITCGIYGYYWAYKMGVCTDKIKGTPNGNTGILYIVLSLIGFGIVNYALIQDAINKEVK